MVYEFNQDRTQITIGGMTYDLLQCYLCPFDNIPLLMYWKNDKQHPFLSSSKVKSELGFPGIENYNLFKSENGQGIEYVKEKDYRGRHTHQDERPSSDFVPIETVNPTVAFNQIIHKVANIRDYSETPIYEDDYQFVSDSDIPDLIEAAENSEEIRIIHDTVGHGKPMIMFNMAINKNYYSTEEKRRANAMFFQNLGVRTVGKLINHREPEARENPTSAEMAKYPSLFQDIDDDSIPDVDDPEPLTPGKSRITEVSLSQEMGKILDARHEYQDTLDDIVEKIRYKFPHTQIEHRTKELYSIINKLRRKKMGELTDIAGAMIVAKDWAELKDIRYKLENMFKNAITDMDDYYKNPLSGYRAIHYIITIDGVPVEIQLKTKRMKRLSLASHTPYKQGTFSPEKMDKYAKLAYQADMGNTTAQHQFDSIQHFDLEGPPRSNRIHGRTATRVIVSRDGKKEVLIRFYRRPMSDPYHDKELKQQGYHVISTKPLPEDEEAAMMEGRLTEHLKKKHSPRRNQELIAHEDSGVA